MDKSAVFLEIDNIDHVTIKHRQKGELDRKAAVRRLLRAMGCFDSAASALKGTPMSEAYLSSLGDGELVALLVRAREALRTELRK